MQNTQSRPSVWTVSALGRWAAVATSLLLLPGASSPSLAAEGDTPGWHFDADSPGRAILFYVAVADGPRKLTFSCQRDFATFSFLVEDLKEIVGPVARTTMILQGGPAQFTVPGAVDVDPDSDLPGFSAEVPLDAQSLAQLAQTLTPLFQSQVPIVLKFGKRTLELPPVSGMPDPGKRFAAACFGG